MTENERNLLIALLDLDNKAVQRGENNHYWPVSSVGGSTGTHHATTLARLSTKRWVDRRRRFEERPRAGWGYRITSGGRQALANADLTRPAKIDAAQARQAAEAKRLGRG